MKKRSEMTMSVKVANPKMRAKDFGAKPKGTVLNTSATDWAQTDPELTEEAPLTKASAVDDEPIWERDMNPEQLQAIRHHEGPVAVLAQAGSGKTRALVHRIARMVAQGTNAESILAVTFSRKAADEMNERLHALGVYDARVGTWHSLCLQILKEDETEWATWTIDEKNVHKRIVKEVIGYKHLNWTNADLGKVMRFIGLSKANLFAPGSVEAFDLAKKHFGAAFKLAADAYEISQNILEERGLLTFDDMLVFLHRHLSVEANRGKWAAKWNFLLQDEAQDANPAQCAIAMLLAKDHRNYMVVGDIAQSIYGFRGSKPTILASFKEEWDATIIEMNRNYRSGRAIVKVANDIIRPATLRMPSDMIPERDFEGTVEVRESINLDGEATEFVTWIEERLARGAKFGDITCLFRTNAQSRALEEALLTKKFPYVVVGGTSFYERKEVKDLLAYLRVAVTGDLESVRRCINTPFRFLGAAFVDRVVEAASENEFRGLGWSEVIVGVANQAGIQSRQRASASEWANIVDATKLRIKAGDRPGSILADIVTQTQYIKFLEKDEGEESIDSSHSANVREMIRVAERFTTTAELLEFISKNLKAAKKQRDDKQAGGERVLLMSIHRSKGLEWPHLFVSGMIESVLPHIKGDPEEERRLAYVAATRARDTLVLSYILEIATRAGVKDATPSRFLKDAGLLKPEEIEVTAFTIASEPEQSLDAKVAMAVSGVIETSFLD